MRIRHTIQLAAYACLVAAGPSARALDWSDNSIGVKYGHRWAEPGISEPIQKTIYEFVHVSGDKLGTNLVVSQVLMSNGADPAAGGGEGAQEFYGFYRRTLSLSKLTGSTMAFGPIKDVSLAARLERVTKNISFAPSARKILAGLSADLAVPKGYAQLNLYAYNERNYNGFTGKSVKFDTTYRADIQWGIPFEAGLPLEWRGGLAVIGTKGKDGFGNDTKTETRLYTELLTDIGSTGLKAGVAYEWWRNKYGADAALIPGAKQSTPQLVAEYHF